MMDLRTLRTQAALWRKGFDRRPKRERMLLAAAAVALAFMLVDSLLLGPALKAWQVAQRQQQAVLEAQTRQSADAARQRSETTLLQRQQQVELATWRQRVRDGEAALLAHQEALVGPNRMLALLDQMLAQQGQLRLRKMQSLERTDLLPAEAAAVALARPAKAAAVAASVPAAAASSAATVALSAPSLYRHGVELIVEGGFADLLGYLRALEAMPQRVLFGDVRFKVETYPKASLSLRLYTLSRDRHWLEI